MIGLCQECNSLTAGRCWRHANLSPGEMAAQSPKPPTADELLAALRAALVAKAFKKEHGFSLTMSAISDGTVTAEWFVDTGSGVYRFSANGPTLVAALEKALAKVSR